MIVHAGFIQKARLWKKNRPIVGHQEKVFCVKIAVYEEEHLL
jgi:hypothetical protein